MTSNIGQTLMGGGGGMLPSLAHQDIAGGNFHDNRESFHDYIYSKLILGEDKEGSGSNNPVFPPTGLPNYASSMGPTQPARTTPSVTNFNNQNPNLGGGMGPQSVSSNTIQSVSEPSIDMHNATIPSSPQVSTLKPSNSKKNIGPKSHHKNQLLSNTIPQINVPNHEGLMAMSKPKKHKSPKKKEKTNFCDVCGRGFAEKYTLNRHMLTHTHVKPYSCTKCNMAFSRSDGLQKHMNAGHRRIDAHHCDVCGGTFNSELSFEQHKREYGTTLPFVCNLCMLAFSQCCHLNYHMKSHSLKSDYGVEVSETSNVDPVVIDDLIPDDFYQPKPKEPCNKIGSVNYSPMGSSLNPDIRIKHEIDDNYPYGKPGDVLQENQAKKNAENAHPSLSNVSAAESSVNANTSNAVGNTISDIDMKKYYDIKVPTPRFLESANTNSDGSQPTEVTLFRCHICGKGFTRKYHMQRHVRLHTRGPIPRAHVLDWTRRPYACGVCKMGFTRQHHLTRHMLIHTGERPHSCHICGKAFRRYTNLSLHVRTVHGSERPFKCPICGRGFPRVYSLQRHLNTHGKNNDAELLMKAGLMPLPRKEQEDAESKNENSSPDYIAIGTKMVHSGHVVGGNGRNDMAADALLSDGEEEEPIHHGEISRERQLEIDRINASIESTIGDVIKGVMAQGKPSKPKGKKAVSAGAAGQLSNPVAASTPPGVNTMHSEQLVPLSLQQQHNADALQQQQHQQQQRNHHHHQQQQQHHQQSQQQQQHSRHPSISQDSDQFSTQTSIMSNAMVRHDLTIQRSAGFNDLSMRSPTPYSQQQQQQSQQHHQQTNGDRSTTPFSLNPHQQQQQNDGRPPSAYSMHHTAQTDKPGTPYTINQNAMSRDGNRPGSAFSLNTGQTINDRSSTPYSHSQQPSNIDRSSTPFMLNQPSNFDAFTGSTASSRSQNQQIVSTPLDRSTESRGEAPILYTHSTNGFQIPMGTMDLSTPRNRIVDPNIRQAPTEFGHNLTMSQAALNEAAAFAHVQATNNLSLFPANATLTYHQQQLMGEALSRLDMELQVAHQGSGQLPTTSHNTNRPPY